MEFWFRLLAVAPGMIWLGLGMVPSRLANRHCGTIRTVSRVVGQLACCASLVTAAVALRLGAFSGPLVPGIDELSGFSVYVDAITAVMITLISFIGLVISRFSLRYLDGDPAQGRFLRWTAFTIGSAMMLVVAGNLVMLTAAWMLTSLGLHQLLTHYPDRPWAIWAARKKFLISRLGDLFLLSALGVTYSTFGTTEYSEIFARAQEIQAGEAPTHWAISLIAALFVLGAMTKSAQFPFHSWLPDTMETPTPVSALMHAGIINAGGFLIIRLSPLISLSPLALDALAVVGMLTAVLGGVVMLTQSSVKRMLAYSTIAQMGFMMLQCGLGAFSAALLHIVAHSAYKAHAFLSSGSVLESAARLDAPKLPSVRPAVRALCLPIAISLSLGLVIGTFHLAGFLAASKPGLAVLGFILTLAITQLIWNALTARSWLLSLRGLTAGMLVCGCYTLAFRLMDDLVAGTVGMPSAASSVREAAILGLAVTSFLAVFTLQALLGLRSAPDWLQTFYVHAMNGFYLDIPARRLTARVWGQPTPVP